MRRLTIANGEHVLCGVLESLVVTQASWSRGQTFFEEYLKRMFFKVVYFWKCCWVLVLCTWTSWTRWQKLLFTLPKIMKRIIHVSWLCKCVSSFEFSGKKYPFVIYTKKRNWYAHSYYRIVIVFGVLMLFLYGLQMRNLGTPKITAIYIFIQCICIIIFIFFICVNAGTRHPYIFLFFCYLLVLTKSFLFPTSIPDDITSIFASLH